jgi:hypothetical protein
MPIKYENTTNVLHYNFVAAWDRKIKIFKRVLLFFFIKYKYIKILVLSLSFLKTSVVRQLYTIHDANSNIFHTDVVHLLWV